MDLVEYAESTAIKPAELARRLRDEHGLKLHDETARLWLRGERQPKPQQKIMEAIEAVTGGKVTRYDLRPDVFGDAPPKHDEAA